MGSKGTGKSQNNDNFAEIRHIVREIQAEHACLSLKDLAVKGSDLITLGFAPGKNLGRCLQNLLDRVLDEQLPNDHTALLAAAKAYLQEENQ